MNGDKSFVDTNILVYAHDRGAGIKQQTARALIESLWQRRKGVISIQVLQEFYVNVRRKALNPIKPKAARQLLADYMCWEVVINDGDSLLQAVELEARYKISFWDALILQAANSAGAAVVYSEDLSHGQRYENVRAVNPFIEADG